jgi:hypothetical protein
MKETVLTDLLDMFIRIDADPETFRNSVYGQTKSLGSSPTCAPIPGRPVSQQISQAKFIWRSESSIEGDDRKVIPRLANKDTRASRHQLGDFLRMVNAGKLFGPTVSELSFLAGGTFLRGGVWRSCGHRRPIHLLTGIHSKSLRVTLYR